ncbi:unnamed protein product [Mytilus coruscus]|uniref:Uncharacterized protein n=1 Tax=Mytilus coruscus TaxID=42192 RepID=A0A6J8AMX1_MYTCO|nr:unnamed protein product [Mytilus coruscus]
MKTSDLVVFVVFCSLSCTCTSLKQDAEIKINRPERSGYVLELAIKQLIETFSNLRTAFAHNELKSAGDVGLVLVESVPILGDIVHFFNENPDQIINVENGLKIINDNIKVLDETIKNIGTRVDMLSLKIDLSVIKKVATDKREISNCFADFSLFLQNPSSKAEQDRLKQCYSKFSYVRQIGHILSNDELTFMQQPIFNQIIKLTGYCDGGRMQDVFGYLLGLYIEGCTALITSEMLMYGNESMETKDECRLTIQTATVKLDHILQKCEKESCEKYIPVLRNTLKSDQVSKIKLKLKSSFPSFNFAVITLRKPPSSGIALSNILIVNHLTLSSQGVVYRVLLWSLKNDSHSAGSHTYGIEYNENEVESLYNGMNLHNKTLNGRTKLSGFLNDSSSSNSFCNRDIDVEYQIHNGIGDDIKDFFQKDQNINLIIPGWAIAVIGISLLCGFSIGFIVCKCRKSR